MSPVGIGELAGVRAADPGAIARAAAGRSRRATIEGDGRLLLVAADHPARGALGVGADPTAMADRHELLRRLCVALDRPGVDGVLGTPDVLEDLLLLGALERKLVIGSMNRAGLQGATFEIDDRFTACDAGTIAAMGFDGGKMLTRVDYADAATAATLERCARAVDALADHGLLALIEPFVAGRVDGRLRVDLEVEAVMRSVAIASGLGRTSAYTWMKLPVMDEMAAVMRATTLPTLLLGGDPSGDRQAVYARWERALAAPGVRGLVVGRALLYPPDGDVAEAVDTAASMVHLR